VGWTSHSRLAFRCQQGLAEIAHLLEAGTITTRISTTAELDAVPGALTALRHGELHRKAAIRLR
jgi:hypothetical protein